MQTSVGTSFLTAMGGKSSLPTGKTTTENGAISLETTGMERVNFFFKMCRGLDRINLEKMLEKSWLENKLDTLKIIYQCRDCRGGGKGERQLFRVGHSRRRYRPGGLRPHTGPDSVPEHAEHAADRQHHPAGGPGAIGVGGAVAGAVCTAALSPLTES